MLLQATGITKSYGVNTVVSNISLQIQDRERIGLVGVNGAGKSTLLQIICGEITADQGHIYKPKETRIGYLSQNSRLHSEESIWNEMLKVFSHLIEAEKELRELERLMADPNIIAVPAKVEELLLRYSARSEWFKEQGGFEMEGKIRGVLHGMGFADFPMDTLVHTLSGGQKTRLALAKILLQSPDLLMLDEPTNHLDIPTLTWLEGYLRSYPGGILVVSHDRYFLDALVETIYEIERTTSRRYTGNYTKYVDTKAVEYEGQMKQFEKQQGEISRMEDFVQRNIVRASTTKRAQSRRKALESMDRLDKPQGDLKRANFTFEIEQPTGKDVLQAKDLSVVFQLGKPLFEQVSFNLTRGEVVALIGPNGVGKSTLFKVLIEQLAANTGTFRWGANVRIGYYDQEQTNINPENRVLDEVWNAFPHMEEARIRSVLGNFLFSGEDVLKKISALSGGEKARVALAKLMLLKANVLILDEPTNHLDIYSKEVLESSLMEYEGTLLFISHDRYFLNKMAERIVELTRKGTNHFLGNYDDYLEKLAEFVEIEAEKQRQQEQSTKSDNKSSKVVASVSAPKDYETDKQKKSEDRSRQRRIEQLEITIAELETAISVLEEKLTDPEVFQNYVLIQETTASIEQKKVSLTLKYEEWEGLNN